MGHDAVEVDGARAGGDLFPVAGLCGSAAKLVVRPPAFHNGADSFAGIHAQKDAVLRLFEIPFEPDAVGEWFVPVPGEKGERFSSREKALGFALWLANEDKKNGSGDSLVCVQGADAQWRLFTPDLLPAGYKKIRRR